MKLSYGFIGSNEIKKALSELENYKHNIWVEQPHQGNHAFGQEFYNLDELLGEEQYLDTFNNLDEYNEFLEEFELEADDKIVSILNKGKIAYMLDQEISDDKTHLIVDSISDGRGSFFYTNKEAKENLKSINPNEALVMWLLR